MRVGNSPNESKQPSVLKNQLQAPVENSPRDLDGYIRFALERSAGLRSAFDSYRAALAKNPQVTALPDPKLNYGYFIRSVETRVGPQNHRVGAAQSFPWFGTLSLRGDVADFEAQAELQRFTALKNRLVYDVSKTYAELVYLHSAVKITEETIQLVGSWERVLQERFRAGTGSHSDLVRVQVELGQLEDRIAEFRDLIRPIEVSFNALLNRDESTSIGIEKDVLEAVPLKKDAALALSISDIETKRGNPELQMLDAMIEARKAGIKLAEKKYYPDFTLGVDYIVTGDREQAPDGGEDAVMSMISINVPLYWEKNRAAVSEARSKKKSIAEMRKDKEYKLSSDFARAKFDLRDSERKIVLYRDTLIPKSEESIEASYTAYEGGQAGFLDVLDSEQRLLDFELSLVRAKADRVIATSKIFMLAGSYSEVTSIDKEQNIDDIQP